MVYDLTSIACFHRGERDRLFGLRRVYMLSHKTWLESTQHGFLQGQDSLGHFALVHGVRHLQGALGYLEASDHIVDIVVFGGKIQSASQPRVLLHSTGHGVDEMLDFVGTLLACCEAAQEQDIGGTLVLRLLLALEQLERQGHCLELERKKLQGLGGVLDSVVQLLQPPRAVTELEAEGDQACAARDDAKDFDARHFDLAAK